MRARLLYGSTIFSGSLLLFLIQPIMAKAILPWFGGAAGVWACALFFFQAALLAGYGYAWWSTRHLTPRGQAVVQLAAAGGQSSAPAGGPAGLLEAGRAG